MPATVPGMLLESFLRDLLGHLFGESCDKAFEPLSHFVLGSALTAAEPLLEVRRLENKDRNASRVARGECSAEDCDRLRSLTETYASAIVRERLCKLREALGKLTEEVWVREKRLELMHGWRSGPEISEYVTRSSAEVLYVVRLKDEIILDTDGVRFGDLDRVADMDPMRTHTTLIVVGGADTGSDFALFRLGSRDADTQALIRPIRIPRDGSDACVTQPGVDAESYNRFGRHRWPVIRITLARMIPIFKGFRLSNTILHGKDTSERATCPKENTMKCSHCRKLIPSRGYCCERRELDVLRSLVDEVSAHLDAEVVGAQTIGAIDVVDSVALVAHRLKSARTCGQAA